MNFIFNYVNQLEINFFRTNHSVLNESVIIIFHDMNAEYVAE